MIPVLGSAAVSRLMGVSIVRALYPDERSDGQLLRATGSWDVQRVYCKVVCETKGI